MILSFLFLYNIFQLGIQLLCSYFDLILIPALSYTCNFPLYSTQHFQIKTQDLKALSLGDCCITSNQCPFLISYVYSTLFVWYKYMYLLLCQVWYQLSKLYPVPRTTDAQRGNSLHCTAENSSHSQIFRYCQSIFCLPHRPNFSDIFDLCLHWVSVVRGGK